ncbi:MAG TPA: BPSS1780 family membrane protein [Burkholderiaceae bacterium]|nr:BPSS1780 family membrane protein [Burkholderiaceae bacterium]HQR68974.1 BPSS1780 family membrane protein [Burkholderiaceae bacterium]
MQVRTLPASAGWAWLRDGLALYRRQAFAFTALVILYTMALMFVASVPLVGLPLAALLVPFGTLGVTAAGRDAERNVMPLPSLLVEGFKGPQRNALLRLGLVHAGMIMLTVVLTSYFASDELARWKVTEGQIDAASVAANMPWDAITVATLLYTPILMLTWFSPQLVAWHRQPVAKALFFSLFACWRNRWPFLVLGLLLGVLFVAVSWLAALVMSLIGASSAIASMLLAPVALVLTSIGYSTQYPIYRTVLEPPTV